LSRPKQQCSDLGQEPGWQGNWERVPAAVRARWPSGMNCAFPNSGEIWRSGQAARRPACPAAAMTAATRACPSGALHDRASLQRKGPAALECVQQPVWRAVRRPQDRARQSQGGRRAQSYSGKVWRECQALAARVLSGGVIARNFAWRWRSWRLLGHGRGKWRPCTRALRQRSFLDNPGFTTWERASSACSRRLAKFPRIGDRLSPVRAHLGRR
jgi:hypothetical protein